MTLVFVGLVLAASQTIGCKSSSSDPLDPLAVEYCAACSEDPGCEAVTNGAINTVCTEETSAYYRCLVDNGCNFSPCSAQWDARNICLGTDAANRVRVRIELATPVANLGQRGTGPTRAGSPFPENSISSIFGALDEGATGVELDVQVTADGDPIVMHDATIDRTTTGTGCVSALTFDEIRATRLLDANGAATDERPPTLAEAYTAAAGNALVNLDLRVFEATAECPVATDREELVSLVLERVTLIGSLDRTLFSSTDEATAGLIKSERPDVYSAFSSEAVETAVSLEQDAIQPDLTVSEATVQAALEAGLQVNVRDASTAEEMMQQIENGASAIITDEPGILANLEAPAP